MKKFFGTAATLILSGALAAAVSAATPWCDLDLSTGTPVDAAGNTSMVQVNGAVTDTTVTYNGTEYAVKAFVGTEVGDTIEIELPFGADGDELGDFLLNGCTFELFFQAQNNPGSTVGLITSCNGGGVTLYCRGADAQLNFQIGTDPNDSELGGGAYASAVLYDNNSKSNPDQPANAWLIPGQIEHIVGTYDKASNTLTLYHNGEFVSSGDYGTGSFKIGNAFGEVVAICQNVAYPSESMANFTEFRVVDANIYNTALTAEEVAAQYSAQMAAIGIESDTISANKEAAAAAEAEAAAAAEAEAAAAAEAEAAAFAEAIATAKAPSSTPWSDLDLSGGTAVDKTGTTEMNQVGGTITDTTVTYNGTEYPVKAFVGAAEGDTIEIKLPFADGTALGEFLLNGCTFEIFFQAQNNPGATVGLITSCNGGGVTLYNRGGDGQLNFQIGTDPNSSELGSAKYAAAVLMDNNVKTNPEQPKNAWLIPGQIEHIVGIYDKETNTLSLYHNGLLVSSGSYGDGPFTAGNCVPDILTICQNVAYPSETMGKYTEFRVVDVNIYNVALTAEEVAGQYVAQMASIGVTLGEVPEAAAPETAAPETTAPETAAPETAAPETAAPETAAPVVSEKAPQTFDISVIAAASVIISAAGYTVFRKKR